MNASAETKWILPQEDRAVTRSLASALRLPGVVAQVLAGRGFTNVADARSFLETRHQPLTDPFTLTDMDAAVDRLQAARANQEHVRVFGDYDVDGMAATAIMTRGLRRFGLRTVTHAMPNRLTEGYGINPDSVAEAARDGVGLIVTVDNGINALDAAEEARRQGVDLIVTDHHTFDDALPDACAVINPHRDDPAGPAAYACGSAVAFMLSTALNGEESDIDLVALATVADVVPLRRENRLLVARGLERIADRAHPGIEALVRRARLNPRDIRAEHIAFQLAPRLNASGRLADGAAALSLLLSNSHGEAESCAAELDRLNVERRAIEDEIFTQALAMAENALATGRRTLVLASTGWHPGVIGIVAARLVSAFWRPVLLIALDENGIGRGSGRSTPDLHMAEAISACQDHLIKQGGHRLAAGLSIEQQRIPDFAEDFEAAARERMPEAPSPRELPLDAVVALSEIDGALLNALDRLEPFGSENPAPVFGSFGVRVERRSAKLLRGAHLRCTIQHGSHAFQAIGFNFAEQWTPDDMPEVADIAYRPQFNTFRGNTNIQLQLRGLRCAE